MSDPVAEAAEQLAALSVANMAEAGATTPFMEKVAAQQEAGTALGNESAVAEASVTAPATVEEAGGAAAGESASAAMATVSTQAEPFSPHSTSADAQSASASLPNLSAPSPSDLPNVASGAAEPTTEPDSAPSADGANTTSPTGASSAEPEATDSRPLHVRVAAHLEAIFQMVKTDAQRAPAAAESHAEHVKTHIGDVLHRISNGMAVAEGEMVQKLEALYRML